ncbi:D-alanyl-D-alanine carboxypeptidase family protein [Gloeocapsopsis crepidinum LEGE 06123]|uniref:D-alanyl-D-alanine carboxypeptidase family protein n=1 Tax=Gloeocapsopsis crepidinum LEGE 06123 TaxID=588587 RepID=A0ABR9UMV5_9CHRO|nr:D-alanyl-D-alanine carboxypeptidase family protein [Gloeocapsopsis crepidinum LEGE 06123]
MGTEFTRTRVQDDIPEALRDDRTVVVKSRKRIPALILSLLGLSAIALVGGVFYFNTTQKNVDSAPAIVTSPSPAQSIAPVNPPDSNSELLLGHFAYEQAPQSELEPITADGRIKMRSSAAKQFKAMVAAARADGVRLVPISGFRSANEQEHLFFDVKAQRGQATTKRASVSAPPGYSEHHTGYAVDIGDANVPATNLSTSFANTKAFKWLDQNAARYSFELSFPEDNPQGVSYEPWHWRYVGDRHSLETFYKAHNIKPTP